MIVVDTNIIGYLYLSSDRSEQVERAANHEVEIDTLSNMMKKPE